MAHTVRFCLALHNHQPIGNFDGVIEQAYQDSYRPLLDVLEQFPQVKFSMHTSGSLMEWLAEHHADYLDRLAGLVGRGQLEIIGGAFYEPILSMIPRRDRVGQIRTYTQWLQSRLGATVRGMWIPERVWEPGHVCDLAEAGIEYTILDDFHFKNAGLTDQQLHGYYITEDEGRLVKVFPGNERLRYVIPFGAPEDTIELLRAAASQHPQAVVVFGDDGEKFGTWPETKKHVYEDGWLVRFLEALQREESWVRWSTLSEAIDEVPPAGKVYLPDSSYREMTEWALPVEQIHTYEDTTHALEHDPRWPALRRFVRGGFWRNFKVKYPESDEMYSRMLMISRRLEEAQQSSNGTGELVRQARTELYRGQCNCSYWHGAFGGIYLPHLRNAVYRHLIAADNLLDQAAGRTAAWVAADVEDFNHDARREVSLANDKLLALLAPSRGGMLYELDVRRIAHNLLATLARRPEAYHRKVQRGAAQGTEHVASIHERIVFKQPGLDTRLHYDWYPRKSLVDHFWPREATLEQLAAGTAEELGDWVLGVYETKVRRGSDWVQAVLSRRGRVWEDEVTITKAVTLRADSAALEVEYQLEGLRPGETYHFGSEFNFSGMPSGADDRYFHVGQGRLGQLGMQLDLVDAHELSLTDEWLGLTVRLQFSRPTGLWTFPIETVSQSEGGFELVHQSVCVVPHWMALADESGRFSTAIQLNLDTSLAASRMEQPAAATAGV